MFAKRSPSPQGRTRPAQTDKASRSTAPVFSYRAARAPRDGGAGRGTQTEQASTRRKGAGRLLQRTSHVVAAGVIVVLVVANLLLGNQVSVVFIDTEVPGSKVFLRSKDIYAQAARGILAESLLNSNKLTISTENVSKKMRQQFPELASVTITLPFIGRQPVVYIQPAAPKLILTTAGGSNFVLADTGRALLTGSQISKLDNLRLPVVNDQSGLAIDVQDTALPSGTVVFITEVVAQLKAKKIDVASLVLPPSTSELHVKIAGAGYSVKFNLQGSAREEAGSFIATKQYLESQKKIPAEYIDVRVENRVYFR